MPEQFARRRQQRQTLFDRLDGLFRQEVPAIVLYNTRRVTALRTTVKGYRAWPAQSIRLWNVTLICLLMLGFLAQISVDYSRGIGPLIVRALRLGGFGSMYVPKSDTSIVESRPFLGNILTSDPVRYARNAAVLEAEPALALGAPTVAWCDAAFRAMASLRERSYPARIRQPILIVAGGNDAVVSNAAIEDFASLLRAGSHLVVVGSQHEILMEQDRFRSQFWAAFDAFVPGTPLY